MTKSAARPTSTMCSATQRAARQPDGPAQQCRRPRLTRATSAGASRPPFAFGIGTDTTFTLKYLHQQEDDLPDYGIPFLFGKPAPVPRDTFYGLPTDDRYQDRCGCRDRHASSTDSTTSFASATRRAMAAIGSTARQTSAALRHCQLLHRCAPYAGAPVCAGDRRRTVPVTTFNPLYPGAGHAAGPDFRAARPAKLRRALIATLMNETDLTGKFLDRHVRAPRSSPACEAGQGRRRPDALRQPGHGHRADAAARSRSVRGFPRPSDDHRQQPDTKTNTLGVYADRHYRYRAAMERGRRRCASIISARLTTRPSAATAAFHARRTISAARARRWSTSRRRRSSVYFSYGTSFNPSAENLSLSASNAGSRAGEGPHLRGRRQERRCWMACWRSPRRSSTPR